MMLERLLESIAKAQAEGRYMGRPKSASLRASEARQMVAEGKTVTEAAQALGIARASVYRALEASGTRPTLYHVTAVTASFGAFLTVP